MYFILNVMKILVILLVRSPADISDISNVMKYFGYLQKKKKKYFFFLSKRNIKENITNHKNLRQILEAEQQNIG